MEERSPTPVVLLAMNGPPGAGKSTLARALSRRLGCPLVDKDDIKDVLDGQAPLAGALSYEIMLRVVRHQALQGLSVVCDSPLPKRTHDGLRSIAEETGARLAVVECRCGNEATWRERIEARQTLELPAHHTTTWQGVERFLSQPDSAYPIAAPLLAVETTLALPEVVEDVVAWLGTMSSCNRRRE